MTKMKENNWDAKNTFQVDLDSPTFVDRSISCNNPDQKKTKQI